MARRKANAPLGVFLNGRNVGILHRASSGAIDFKYAPAWLEWDKAFAVSLSLPLREDRYIGASVIAVFDNLLPDSDGIRRRVAERVGAEGTDAYSMLAALGHDCVGALQFLPEDQAPGPVGGTLAEPVTEDEIAGLLSDLEATPLGMGDDASFRISIAGVQEKTALLRKAGRWFKPSGTTATTHILKPQISRSPMGIFLPNSVENEFLCLTLMAAFGIPTAKAEIVDFCGRRTLVVERFDRLWTQDGRLLRLPQEDFCQALSIPSTRKYENQGGPGIGSCVNLLKGSDRPDEDVSNFLRTQLVFWLIGATDGHAKNFSVFLSPGGRYRLTPVYDVLSTQPMFDEKRITKRQFKLAMSMGTNRHYEVEDIVPRHFLETARAAGVGTTTILPLIENLVETASAKVADTMSRVDKVPDSLKTSLQTAIGRRLPLLARMRP